jgi:hypothetical protein
VGEARHLADQYPLPRQFRRRLQRAGFGITGGPGTVRDALLEQFPLRGNYSHLVCRFAFGDLSL